MQTETRRPQSHTKRFFAEARQDLNEWGQRLAEMKDEASRMADDRKHELQQLAGDLERKRRRLADRVGAAREQGEAALDDLEHDLGRAKRDFRAGTARIVDALRD